MYLLFRAIIISAQPGNFPVRIGLSYSLIDKFINLHSHTYLYTPVYIFVLYFPAGVRIPPSPFLPSLFTFPFLLVKGSTYHHLHFLRLNVFFFSVFLSVMSFRHNFKFDPPSVQSGFISRIPETHIMVNE